MRTPVTHLYAFGPFQLEPLERLLLCDGQPVPTPPKAFDLLVFLVERRGHLVEKNELLQAVWPGSFVEEGNLSVTVSFLRKVLGDDRGQHKFIETVSKRGYRFVAEVNEVGETQAPINELQPSQVGLAKLEGLGGKRTFPPETLATPPSSPSSIPAGRLLWRFLLLVAIVASMATAFILLKRQFLGWDRSFQAPMRETVRSLAILPFSTIGAKPGDEYLGLGIADALITRLANTGKVIVRPTSAIQKYTGMDMNPQAAGQEQGVDAVLDGRIQRETDRVRLTVQLLRVSDGAQLWGETFDRESTNIFALEDALSERVAQSIQLQLTGEETRRFNKRSTEKPDAYEAYVKGRYFWNKRTDKGLKKGLEYFRRAIALDPGFAEAYVGVADSYATLGLYALMPPKQAFPAAKEAATRALEMDDGLAEAHATLGFIHFYYDWNPAEAVNEFRRALASNPNYSMAHSWYGETLAAMGRYPEAVNEARNALQDDPLSLIVGTNAGWTFCLAGKYDEGVSTLTKAIEIDPAFPRTHFRLGRAYEQQKKYDLAISELAQAVRVSDGDAYYKGSLGHVYAVAGKIGPARKIIGDLEQLSQHEYVPGYAIALIYAGLGDKAHALRWLQKAYDDRSTSMVFLRTDPELITLHDDLRFEELARRTGL